MGRSVNVFQILFWKYHIEPLTQVVSDPIREGAEGFLKVQYTEIARIAMGVMGVIVLSYVMRPTPNAEHTTGVKSLSNLTLGITAAVTFIMGSFCSAISGYVGVWNIFLFSIYCIYHFSPCLKIRYVSMWVSAQSNIRVASAARHSYSQAFLVCFRGGAFSAILAIVMCIFGVSTVYLCLYVWFVVPGYIAPVEVPLLMVGFGFGASFVALCMQLGGGIYTKAADVGSDLVGKLEFDLVEDDPRNPAVIADLVGDMVGDCVGSSADLFESISAEIIGAMILGASLAKEAGIEDSTGFVFFPVLIHAFDILVSSIGKGWLMIWKLLICLWNMDSWLFVV